MTVYAPRQSDLSCRGLWGGGALPGFVLAQLLVDLRYAQTFRAALGEPLEPACRPEALALGLKCLEV